MRNFLIHGYHQVETDLVWEVIDKDLHILRPQINNPHPNWTGIIGLLPVGITGLEPANNSTHRIVRLILRPNPWNILNRVETCMSACPFSTREI